MSLIVWLSRRWKAVAALVTSVATWAGTALVDGKITSGEWPLLIVALVVPAGAVYAVSNAPPSAT